ncbi:hypothetical protein E3N88_34788 [Mikania micrantha]|uniref:Uncharacterized protein n=1 Tax=Mikania micrantha TaxID=192012 RepID=A0A5N6LZA1_9ASTR|nr:hypothetical protein E3N88_34788 [Mikania micrantha]
MKVRRSSANHAKVRPKVRAVQRFGYRLAGAEQENVEGYAWTPKTPKSVEKRRSYARLMLGFSRERLENEFGRERESLAAFNEENGLLQGFYSPGGIRVRFGRSVRVSGT